jgi:hypothetical protein
VLPIACISVNNINKAQTIPLFIFLRAIIDANDAAAEAERKRLAAIEAQKVADAEKVKANIMTLSSPANPIVETTPLIMKPTPESTRLENSFPGLPTGGFNKQKSSNNTLLIGGILLALVGVYIITKKD